jgi:hypothetical protein
MRTLTKWLAVFSNHPDAEDAKLMPVRTAAPRAWGDRYGSWNGSPSLRAAVESTPQLHNFIRAGKNFDHHLCPKW